MDFLRSPWRYGYVSTAGNAADCVFCIDTSDPADPARRDERDERDEDDARRLVLHRSVHNFVIMNLYPYTSGHLMVVPYAHVGELAAASPEQLSEMMLLARASADVLGEAYRPEGFNVGMNIGVCAGAGVRDHIHLHVVPRWCGDSNFMTSTGETRVLPEDLETGFRRLKPLFSRLG
jgi:ATP adenylyltransferase